jgi:hypothetical protein
MTFLHHGSKAGRPAHTQRDQPASAHRANCATVSPECVERAAAASEKLAAFPNASKQQLYGVPTLPRACCRANHGTPAATRPPEI